MKLLLNILLAVLFTFLFFDYSECGIKHHSFPKATALSKTQHDTLPSFDELLQRMESNSRQIEDYQVTLDIVAKMKGFHFPPMQVTVFFKQPDKFSYQSRGFALLPRNAITVSPSRLRELSKTAEVVAVDTIADKYPVYHLQIVPKIEDKNIDVKMDVWVDTERFIVLKVRSESNQFGWLEVNNQFDQIDDRYWLPIQSHIQIDIRNNNLWMFKQRSDVNPNLKLPGETLIDHLSGSGQMYITFRNYKVNQGIPYEVFQKEK